MNKRWALLAGITAANAAAAAWSWRQGLYARRTIQAARLGGWAEGMDDASDLLLSRTAAELAPEPREGDALHFDWEPAADQSGLDLMDLVRAVHNGQPEPRPDFAEEHTDLIVQNAATIRPLWAHDPDHPLTFFGMPVVLDPDVPPNEVRLQLPRVIDLAEGRRRIADAFQVPIRVLCDCPTPGLPCGCGLHTSDDEQVVTFADDRLDLCWLCNERTEEGPTGLCGPCLDRKRAEAHG